MPVPKDRFADSDFRCKKCARKLGSVRMQAQLLVLEPLEIAIFNFARFRCMAENCNAVNNWQSPNLLPVKNEIEKYPDSLEDLPKPPKKLKTNKTGFPGVTRNKNKFAARVNIKGKEKYLGLYESPEKAHRVYLRAKSAEK